MTRLFTLLFLGSWIASSLGCAMCNSCGDDCYTFYGGSVPRTDYCHGRVGSAFEPAGQTVAYADDEEYSEEEYEETGDEDMSEAEADLAIPQGALDDAAENEESLEEVEEVADDAEDLPPVVQPRATSRVRGKSPRLNQQNYLP
jgi:hypothetical protein